VPWLCLCEERAGKDGAAPGGDEHSRAAANDEGDRRRHRTDSDESSSDSDSDKDSDVSEQASYPEGYSHLMLDGMSLAHLGQNDHSACQTC
jgi:hypothetical protein